MKPRTSSKRWTTPLAASLLLLLAFEAPAQEIVPARAASLNPNATLGMSQVLSAESIGEGTVNLTFRGSLYNQERTLDGAPPANTQVSIATLGLALGLNQYLDAFTALNVHNYRENPGESHSGFGSTLVGAKFTAPFARDQRIRMGAELTGIFGTSSRDFNGNRTDGYGYLETRTGSDVVLRLTQSLLLTGTPKKTGFKFHLNEGLLSSFESGNEVQLLTGAGVEFIPIVSLMLGLEVNSRTYLIDPSLTDPLWATPSVTWRTPAFINVTAGVDVALSPDRDAPASSRALEPWRAFGALTYSIDTRADERREAALKARERALKIKELTARAENAENRADSVDAKADSLAVLAAVARVQARNDSIALAESDKRLREELARRPEIQRQLLTTGLLVLDAVYFETGKTTISMNSEPYLALIAKMLTQYPKLNVEVGGHTDNVGGLEYNQDLSQRRSDAVVAYMVKIAPSLQGRLSGKGYAYAQPKASNATAEGREKNRRTELKVLNREALTEYR